jgi:hypothetical protein
MEILLALAAAVSYGVSDFAGGVLTRPAHVFVVFLLSQRQNRKSNGEWAGGSARRSVSGAGLMPVGCGWDGAGR